MKRFLRVCLVAGFALGCSVARAQDGALEQRIRELSGRIETLIEGQEAQRKRMEDLYRQVDGLREKQNRPQPEYASQEDLRRLADAMREVDRKRLDDYERIREELRKLGRTIRDSVAERPPKPSPAAPRETSPEPVSENGREYEVKPGDTLSTIIQAYRNRNIKVTLDEILKANPGLKPDRMQAGRTIWIPAP